MPTLWSLGWVSHTSQGPIALRGHTNQPSPPQTSECLEQDQGLSLTRHQLHRVVTLLGFSLLNHSPVAYPGAGREVKAAICLAEPDSHHIKTLHTLRSKHPGCDRTGNVPFSFHVCFLSTFQDAVVKSNAVRLTHHRSSHVGYWEL